MSTSKIYPNHIDPLRRKSKDWKFFQRASSPHAVEGAVASFTQVGTCIVNSEAIRSAIGQAFGAIHPIEPRTNPNQEWEGLKQALDQLYGHPFPGILSPLQSSVGTLSKCIDGMEISQDNQDLLRVASSLIIMAESLAPHLNSHNFTDLSDQINRTVQSIQESIAKINEIKKHTSSRRLFEPERREEEMVKCWETIEGALKLLQSEVEFSRLRITNRDREDKLLEFLNPSKQACYDSIPPGGIVRRICAKGTRKKVLEDLDLWSEPQSISHLYWMNGMAGTGKTTIAYSFANALQGRGMLAASFFCSRLYPEFRQVNRILPTIAYQLAMFSEGFRAQLCAALENEPDLGSASISKQFDGLLQEPFRNLAIDQFPEGAVVVIDALDECEHTSNDRTAVNQLLDLLIKRTEELPLKFLVTSRPQPHIYSTIKSTHDSKFPVSFMSLHDVDKSEIQADIQSYLEEELASMSLPHDQIMRLVEQCNTLFVYAATIVRYIRPKDASVPSVARLKKVLEGSMRHAEIDGLYSFVLRTAFGDGLEEDEAEILQKILWTVLCAKEPIDMRTVAALCGLDEDDDNIKFLSSLLERLRSVIYFSETSNLISVFDASFLEFLFSRERSGEFFCDPAEHNLSILHHCFGLMKNGLRFNICGLESSYTPDEQSDKLQARIDKAIPPPLWYACHNWAAHLWSTTDLQPTTNSEKASLELREFLSERLLFWMEVLNLKQIANVAVDMLLVASSWVKEAGLHIDVEALLEDANSFATSFAFNPVSVSTPHIYTSLLPLCLRSSSVFRNYRKLFKGLAQPDYRMMQVREGGALASWKPGSKVLSVACSRDGAHVAFGCLDGTVGVQSWGGRKTFFSIRGDQGHDKPVWSVAFSPHEGQLNNQSGAYVVSGSEDGTIRTWNPLDGTTRIVIGPLPGEIYCVAASPKGAIASGSSDGTVCIWDSTNGELSVGPLRGHHEAIWSVAFSPDGTKLASGSDDHTIRIWNSSNGHLVLGPLKAQTDEINTLAFSPDGAQMASGSSDKTICVWDPHSGTVISGPTPAHNDKVTAVTFSFDGKYLASSSFDRTICVWNPIDGKLELAAGPLEGHNGPVYSIAFSPDGTRIISGSPDGTIQIWNPHQGALGDRAVKSHSDAVSATAFSPDGQHIASCSYDSTLRVWDVRETPPIGGDPLRGHTDHLLSLAFSPDGTRVVTGSLDRTARVWDIIQENSTPIVFEGHSDAIWSVAFAPDGSFVASGGGKDDKTIHLWDPLNGTPIASPLTGHTHQVNSIAISPDGKTLVSGSYDATIRVWDLGNTSNFTILQGHDGAIWSIVYSSDATQLASCSSDGAIRIWDLQNEPKVLKSIQVLNDRVAAISFSPDNKYIASGADDFTIRIWDVCTGELAGGPFVGHHGTIWSIAYSPSGKHIVSGSHDGTIRLWDIANRAPVVNKDNADEPDMLEGDWTLQPDGWIKRNDDLLLWIPHGVARSLLTPHCLSVISSCLPLRISLGGLKHGKSWQECYIGR